ncbi:tRNA pseudouridine(55) synthase TruB [Halosquirtibacter laminarini]|uniref:tRNA pseudouridine(55) synthase TruB n=1 Tax=Halosquirtibacter laminarini TaxID=3374600 RepID=A0AC61NQG4_9BACT|nr:tRNA pseudouridine(55) synthase TruB [Prolixibacteraceae bacterium]
MDSFDFKGGEVLTFDKPLEWTSFNVVGKIRYKVCRLLGVKKLKVGHAGTLDPMATGLMVLCTGKATKKIEQIQGTEKEYIADLKLGATTPSFDVETEEDAHFPTDHVDLEKIKSVIPQFLGEIDQTPPIFSAVKVNGRRAYDMARKGEEVELRSKKIFIKEIEVLDFKEQHLVLRVVCGKGTYIRSLARDFGKALESGAYLTALRRTRVGDFDVKDAYTIEAFCEMIDRAMESNK